MKAKPVQQEGCLSGDVCAHEDTSWCDREKRLSAIQLLQRYVRKNRRNDTWRQGQTSWHKSHATRAQCVWAQQSATVHSSDPRRTWVTLHLKNKYEYSAFIVRL